MGDGGWGWRRRRIWWGVALYLDMSVRKGKEEKGDREGGERKEGRRMGQVVGWMQGVVGWIGPYFRWSRRGRREKERRVERKKTCLKNAKII